MKGLATAPQPGRKDTGAGAPSSSELALSSSPPRCPAQPRPLPHQRKEPCPVTRTESRRNGNGNEEACVLGAHTVPVAAAPPPPAPSTQQALLHNLASCSQPCPFPNGQALVACSGCGGSQRAPGLCSGRVGARDTRE